MGKHGEPVGHMLDDMCFLGAIALFVNALIQPWLTGLGMRWCIGMALVALILQVIGLKINTKPSYWAWFTVSDE